MEIIFSINKKTLGLLLYLFKATIIFLKTTKISIDNFENITYRQHKVLFQVFCYRTLGGLKNKHTGVWLTEPVAW